MSSFIDSDFIVKHGLPKSSLRHAVPLNMADGHASKSGPVTHFAHVRLSIQDHHEDIALHVTKIHRYPIILGVDWLEKHNPRIHWRRRLVRFDDPFCNKHCTSQCSVSTLSIDNSVLPWSLDNFAMSIDDHSVNFDDPTIDDYYAAQLAASYAYQSSHHSVSDIPDLSCFSISSDEKEDPSPAVLPEMYSEFAELFKDRPVGELPPHRPCDHAIPLEPDAKIPFGPLYTLSQKELEELREYIDDNLKKGFIRRSESPAGAPVLFVPKKNSDKLRLCVDYRALNKVTVKNRCPLPLISETLERLGSARVFTKLDLKGAYNLVRVAEGDEWKTAFRTRYGHFEYLVMPFGLTNAPATFQSFLNDVLRECLDTVVVIYLDDILIYSKDEESHVGHVRRVLQLLSDAQLQVNLEKCQFHVNKVEFLGYVISPEGISMDPAKVAVIANWPTPHSVHDIQVFLGFSNFYRRFIKNFSKLVGPITRLLKKNVPFKWCDKAQAAFEQTRASFLKDPVLVHFDPSKPCFLEPDASNTAIGAVVSQPEENGVLHPVAFYSRSLTSPERNYHIHDTELLAAIEGLEHWRHFFAYSAHPATILTDHKNLEYFSEKRALSARQIRYSERLSKFNIAIVYRPGVLNGAADALSRMHAPKKEESASQLHEPLLPRPITTMPKALSLATVNESESTTLPPILLRIRAAYEQDHITREALAAATHEPNDNNGYILDQGLLYNQGRLVVPDVVDIKRDILSACHDSPTSGHFGIKKTFELVNRTYTWPGLRQFIKKFVVSCDTCQRNKSVQHKPFGLLQSLPVPESPWSSISMDFIVQLPASDGFTSIFVVVDRMTKMAHFIPTTDNIDADGTVSLFMARIVSLHGLPDNIVSDRGVTFTAQFTQAYMKALGVKQNLSTAFHPQTDGQTERTNATLEQYLRCFINYQQDNWSTLLPMAEFCYNNTVHSSTNQTPFYALHGYHPRFHVDVPRVSASTPLAHKRLQSIKGTQEDLQFHIATAQESQAHYYNQDKLSQPDYQPGDLVWLLRRNIKTTRPSDKLDVKRLGPYKIVEAVNTRAFRLELPSDMTRTHPVFHVSLLEPYHGNTIPGRAAPPPPPIEVEGELEYEVESIVDSRRFRRQLQYRVVWKGYPEANWEPAVHVAHCAELVSSFHSKYPDKPGPDVVPIAGHDPDPDGRS